jgi:hypothetical protein
MHKVMESKVSFEPISLLRCCLFGVLEALVMVICDWLLMLASSLYLVVYVCRHAQTHMVKLRSRARYLPLTQYNDDDIPLNITMMSGHSEEVRAKRHWSIHDVKDWLAANMYRESGEAIPANQMRLFDGCHELHDDSKVEQCPGTQLTLMLRSGECAQWLDRLHQDSSCDLIGANESVRSSKECVLASARLSGTGTLEQVPNFKDDDDVVMAAVQNDGLSLSLASFRLRADAAIALCAVGRDRESLVTICEPLRSDPKFLRRAYWVSTLDCKPLERLTLKEGGNFQTWQDVLYGDSSTLRAKLWSAVHLKLRERNPAFNMLSSVMPVFLPFLTGKQTYDFFGHPILGAFVVYMIVLFLCAFIMNAVVSSMLVDFVRLVAGPLTNPQRSSCRCCK